MDFKKNLFSFRFAYTSLQVKNKPGREVVTFLLGKYYFFYCLFLCLMFAISPFKKFWSIEDVNAFTTHFRCFWIVFLHFSPLLIPRQFYQKPSKPILFEVKKFKCDRFQDKSATFNLIVKIKIINKGSVSSLQFWKNKGIECLPKA